MSWQKPNSQWLKELRVQIRSQWMFIPQLFAISLVIGTPLMIASMWLPLLTPIAINLPWVIYSIFKIRRQRRIIKRVPETDGNLCPWCLTQVHGTRKTLLCPQCQRCFDHDNLIVYWHRYVYDNVMAVRLTTIANRGGKCQERRIGRNLWYKQNKYILLIAAIWLVYLIVVPTWVGIEYFRTCLITSLEYALPVIGMMMVGSLPHTDLSSSQRFCAKCQYRQTPDKEKAELCPECGHDWLNHGEYTIGEKVTPYHKRWAGVILLLIVLVLATYTGDLAKLMFLIQTHLSF